jgi:DNA-binding response OmpR family regulator
MKNIQILLNIKDYNILYIENDPFQMKQTLNILSMFFSNIKTAGDGLEALNIFKKNKFNLIISDIFLPKVSGIEFAQRIREIDKDIDFIFISSSNNINDLKKIIQIQALDFLTKPYSFSDLQNALLKFGEKYIEDKSNLFKITNDVLYDSLACCAIINEQKIDLTKKEQQLFLLATKNKQNILTYEQIKEALDYKEINIHSIKNVILRLRKKLSTDIFINIKSVGYRVI